MRWEAGRFELAFSRIEESPFRFRVGITTSEDLSSFGPVEVLDEPRAGGLASPDLTRAPSGELVLAVNTHTRDGPLSLPKLYRREGAGPGSLCPSAPLPVESHDGPFARLIDAALAHTPVGSASPPSGSSASRSPGARREISTVPGK